LEKIMSEPLQTMPLKKQLSYLFARATGQDVLCSRMVKQVEKDIPVGAEFDHDQVAYHMDRTYFRWAEARPVPGERDNYTVAACVYSRNEISSASGDRAYGEERLKPESGKAYFTRDEAVALLKDIEDTYRNRKLFPLADRQPLTLRQVSVYRGPK
jgi:hypothetical protein